MADRATNPDSPGRTRGSLRSKRPIPVADGLVAATALVHDLTLVTRNTRDFAGLGVRPLNPFAEPEVDDPV